MSRALPSRHTDGTRNAPLLAASSQIRRPDAALRANVLAWHLAAAGVLLAAAGWTPDAHAQAAADQGRPYGIPAGPLTATLNRFAEAAGVFLSAPAELTVGKASSGLSGTFTVEQGFAELLRGQGLQAVRQANGGYVLNVMETPAAAPGARSAATLPVVNVRAQTLAAAVTEGSDSYTTSSMSTATRLPLSIRDTPQSATVITRERMDDQAMSEVRDVMLNTPGIAATSISGPNRNVYYSRGFLVENYTFDGMTASYSSTGGRALVGDLAMYDRIEVVRGSTGLTQGAGTPSAAINFVRKRPTRDGRASVQGQLGSWDHYDVEADASGPLNEAGTLRGRAVVHGYDRKSFQDVAAEDRQFLYLVGEADIGRDTLLTLSLSHLKDGTTTTYAGLPTSRDGSDLHLPRSTFLGNKWNFWDEANTSAFASLEHRLASGWKLNLSINQIWGRQDRFVSGISMNENDGYDLTAGTADIRNNRTSYDLSASGPFSLLGRKHELVVGAGSRIAEETNDVAGYWPPIYLATDIDVYNWHHDAPKPTSLTQDFHTRGRETQYGFYGLTRLDLADPLKLILGLRVDWFKYTETGRYLDWDAGAWESFSSDWEYKKHLTKYAGLVYDLNARHSIYASYTDIFQAQDARDTSNRFVKPIVGKNYEIGIKGEYFNRALNVSASVFRVNQANLAMAIGNCPFNPSMVCYAPAGLVRSDGYELEAQGALTSNWQIAAGYTYVATKVIRDGDPDVIGTRLNTQLPSRQFKLSTAYRFPGGQWRIGGGMRWQSTVNHEDDWDGYTYRTEQKAYTIVDAMVAYRLNRNLDFRLNVTNLFDKVYYREINAQPVAWGGNALYGEPRKLMLTARYTF